jgi:hypothetical protein
MELTVTRPPGAGKASAQVVGFGFVPVAGGVSGMHRGGVPGADVKVKVPLGTIAPTKPACGATVAVNRTGWETTLVGVADVIVTTVGAGWTV